MKNLSFLSDEPTAGVDPYSRRYVLFHSVIINKSPGELFLLKPLVNTRGYRAAQKMNHFD